MKQIVLFVTKNCAGLEVGAFTLHLFYGFCLPLCRMVEVGPLIVDVEILKMKVMRTSQQILAGLLVENVVTIICGSQLRRPNLEHGGVR